MKSDFSHYSIDTLKDAINLWRLNRRGISITTRKSSEIDGIARDMATELEKRIGKNGWSDLVLRPEGTRAMGLRK